MSNTSSPLDSYSPPPLPDGSDLPASPHAGLWLWYLYAQPRRFFQHFVQTPIPVLTAMAVWMCGMAALEERLQQRMLTRPETASIYFDSWVNYLLVVVIGGIVSGVIY